MSSCHHVIMSSCHHVIMSSCQHVIMSACLTWVLIDIHSISAATLQWLVPTAVHVTLRWLGSKLLWGVVSTEAFLRELNSGKLVIPLKTCLLTLFNCVCGGRIRSVGKISQSSFIIFKTLASNYTVHLAEESGFTLMKVLILFVVIIDKASHLGMTGYVIPHTLRIVILIPHYCAALMVTIGLSTPPVVE